MILRIYRSGVLISEAESTAGETLLQSISAAVDIGTTTVVAHLIDTAANTRIATASVFNEQFVEQMMF